MGDLTVPGSLAEALAVLQGQLPHVAKDQTAKVEKDGRPVYSYKYADLTDVTAALMPLMSRLGLSFTAAPTILEDSGRFVLDYALKHVSGESTGGMYPLPTSGSPQDIGKAITYARRYSLTAVTGLAPGGDDDDAQSAEAAHHEARKQPRNVPDAQLAASGQMTRAQKADHERLAADTVRDPKRAERSRGPDADDPWAQDAPVDHERAANLRASMNGRDLTDPEDKPGTSTFEQQQKIAIELAAKGITAREDKLVFCATVTGRDIASSKELSLSEAAAVLKAARELEAVNA